MYIILEYMYIKKYSLRPACLVDEYYVLIEALSNHQLKNKRERPTNVPKASTFSTENHIGVNK